MDEQFIDQEYESLKSRLWAERVQSLKTAGKNPEVFVISPRERHLIDLNNQFPNFNFPMRTEIFGVRCATLEELSTEEKALHR